MTKPSKAQLAQLGGALGATMQMAGVTDPAEMVDAMITTAASACGVPADEIDWNSPKSKAVLRQLAEQYAIAAELRRRCGSRALSIDIGTRLRIRWPDYEHDGALGTYDGMSSSLVRVRLSDELVALVPTQHLVVDDPRSIVKPPG